MNSSSIDKSPSPSQLRAAQGAKDMMTEIKKPTAKAIELVEKGVITVSSNISILHYPTGSGKTHSTTAELKKRFLSHGEEAAFALPSRLTAQNASREISQFGIHIGSKANDKPSKEEKVEDQAGTFYTYGMLFEQFIKDPMMSRYKTIVFDEADLLLNEEERFIPFIRWLSKARPDLSIIFLSATIDEKKMKTVFNVSGDRVDVIESSERSRPIDERYPTPPKTEEGRGIKKKEPNRSKFETYSKDIVHIIGQWIEGDDGAKIDRIDLDEAGLVLLPSYRSISDTQDLLEAKYADKIEIRIIKGSGNMSEEEQKESLSRPSKDGKILIFLATDVISRGLNFGPEINANRVIHTGVAIKPTLNTIIGRDATKSDIINADTLNQGIGRIARNPQDNRQALAHILQYKRDIKKFEFEKSISDPSRRILVTAKLYSSIINRKGLSPAPTYMEETQEGLIPTQKPITEELKANTIKYSTDIKDLPTQYMPSSFLEFLEVGETSSTDKKVFDATINKLQQVGALDNEYNLTEKGEFLLRSRLSVDLALMLYYSMEQSNPEFTVRLANTTSLINEGKIITDRYNYERFIQSKNFGSDLEALDYIINTMNPSTYTANGIDRKTVIFANQNAQALCQKLGIQPAPKGGVFLKAKYNNALKDACISAFAQSLSLQEGNSYSHLESSEKMYVSDTSIVENTKDKPQLMLVIDAMSFINDKGTTTNFATIKVPVTLDDIRKHSQQTGWLIHDLPAKTKEYNPQTGQGQIITETIFKSQSRNRSITINQEVSNIETDSEMVNALAVYLIQNYIDTSQNLRLQEYSRLTGKPINSFATELKSDIIDQLNALQVTNLNDLLKKEPNFAIDISKYQDSQLEHMLPSMISGLKINYALLKDTNVFSFDLDRESIVATLDCRPSQAIECFTKNQAELETLQTPLFFEVEAFKSIQYYSGPSKYGNSNFIEDMETANSALLLSSFISKRKETDPRFPGSSNGTPVANIDLQYLLDNVLTDDIVKNGIIIGYSAKDTSKEIKAYLEAKIDSKERLNLNWTTQKEAKSKTDLTKYRLKDLMRTRNESQELSDNFDYAKFERLLDDLLKAFEGDENDSLYLKLKSKYQDLISATKKGKLNQYAINTLEKELIAAKEVKFRGEKAIQYRQEALADFESKYKGIVVNDYDIDSDLDKNRSEITVAELKLDGRTVYSAKVQKYNDQMADYYKSKHYDEYKFWEESNKVKYQVHIQSSASIPEEFSTIEEVRSKR